MAASPARLVAAAKHLLRNWELLAENPHLPESSADRAIRKAKQGAAPC